ncbi:MAG: tetratricopeptide repeat protein [Burkholderiales bacterium]|nr:tetratricopeptide repeat protein [Burkholderiales bacterium]
MSATVRVFVAALALDVLKRGDPQLKRRAVLWLGDVGTMDDVPVLLVALRDDDEWVRAVSEQSIWSIWGRSGDDRIDALMRQGAQEMQAGLLKQAVATFTRVVKAKPAFAEAWNKRATAYWLLGDSKASLADCDEVMKRNPYHFGALAGYGQIWFARGEPEKSREYFRKALSLNPNMQGVALNIEGLEQLLAEKRRRTI